MAQDIELLIRTIVESIVDDVSALTIVSIESEKGISYEIQVGKDDVGKIIGKEGRIANAIRTIAKAAGAKLDSRIMVNILNRSVDQDVI